MHIEYLHAADFVGPVHQHLAVEAPRAQQRRERVGGHGRDENQPNPGHRAGQPRAQAPRVGVARRIAHEIKNPLTPIQLSAERLRRKYGKVITEDKAVFEQCTDTIVRQVDDIKRMVDEFSKFARMPKAVMTNEDVADTVRQAVFLQRVGNADMDIDLEIAEDPMPARFDRRLISQALTNIIKNATEAIEAVPQEELGKGKIEVVAARDGEFIVIDVIDNGIGLPKESRSRLLEPYVTTREKGTGLGLSTLYSFAEQTGGSGEANSCTVCHSPDPRKVGQTRAGQAIDPIAVSANPKRLTDYATVEKWFRRNCDTVLGRECTVIEKGNFLTFMSGQ